MNATLPISFGIAYDSKRRRIVEFGGTDGSAIDLTADYYTRGGSCASDAECHTGVCVKKLPSDAAGICAEPCTTGAPDDGTGPCVDGFRCNETCTGKCRTCSDVPGVCTPVVSRPDEDTCTGPGTCSASGDCLLALGQPCIDSASCASNNCAAYGQHVCSVPGCGVQQCTIADASGNCSKVARGASYPCAGNLTCDDGTCLTLCATDADCAPDFYCDTASGECKVGKRYGSTCATSEECGRGAPCVDGVCCQTDCSGACEKCGAGGKCETLPRGSQPVAPRQPCSGTGECAGFCPGNDSSCFYPGATQRCEKADCPTGDCKTSCNNDWITEWTCNGGGECVQGLPHDCFEYACHDGACEQRCDDHTQCRAGATCDRRLQGCVPVRRGCASKYQIELQDGTIVDCRGYLCFGDNQCSQQCDGDHECADGFRCEDRRCIPAPASRDAGAGATDAGDADDGGVGQPEPKKQTEPADDGCMLVSRTPDRRSSAAIPLALLALAYWRRKRRTSAGA